MVKDLVAEDPKNWSYVTLDNAEDLSRVRSDPLGFIRNLDTRFVAIDEVQLEPRLYRCIKQAVDEDREARRYVLTGSADLAVLPELSDSMVGRMMITPLFPLSECEILSRAPTFLNLLLDGEVPSTREVRFIGNDGAPGVPGERGNNPTIRNHLLERLTVGCYPTVVGTTSNDLGLFWFENYVDTHIQRTIEEVSTFRNLHDLRPVLTMLATFSGNILNYSGWGSALKMNKETFKKYIWILDALFLVDILPAWHTNNYKRLVKAPKLHMLDTGLACHLLNRNKSGLADSPREFGALLESFVYSELLKQSYFINKQMRFYHYRDKDKNEVDVVIEAANRECFAIEVKAKASISRKDFIGLRRFRDIAGDRFKLGIVLYDGDHKLMLDDRLYAVPIAALWEGDPLVQ